MAGYYTLTTADIGKVLAFPLPRFDGTPNDFTGASASLLVRDQNGNSQAPRMMSWNALAAEWEYSVRIGDFAAGRYRAMVAVAFPGGATVLSSEVIFDVVTAD
jgi:hypothetical protein